MVWSLASHHPERCWGVANLCVPYLAAGFSPRNLIPLVNRAVYPEAQYPAGQWDYMLFYEESFEKACAGFDADPRNMVKALFRKGSPGGKGKPSRTAQTRKDGGWFGGAGRAPDVPMDADVVTAEELDTYAAGLARNGFFGPDSWYMNAERNLAYASAGEGRRRASACPSCSCTASTTTRARPSTPGSPSPCGATAGTSPRWSCPRGTGWRRRSRAS